MSDLPRIVAEQLMQRDVARLMGQRRHLQRSPRGHARDPAQVERFANELQASLRRRAGREQALPRPEFPPDLPISAHCEEIVAAITEHPVVIVAGETGSGKSTQLPKMALQAQRGVRGLIGCTQPRRIAARAVARRVAEELRTELGQAVGFQVRFADRVSSDGYIKFMTDGILLAEIHSDRYLDRYDTLIIDEAHERSLNIDFLLGYIKQLLALRGDLKVLITSATIDTESFSRHFSDAPVIQVEGRGHPVAIEYQTPADDETPAQQVLRAVTRCARIDPLGDILVFLPGEREIFQIAKTLKRAGLAHTEVLPLYARLPTGAQDRVFSAHSGRRIVLATNVAETSLTVPGIRFVIDSGLARISRFASHSKVLRLPIEPISQASCNQRAGRCGRVGPGTCIRLFGEDDFQGRAEYTEPEIRRAGLVGVVLEMLALGLGDPEDFPFIDAPPARLINEAFSTLVELRAVDDRRRLAPLGRKLAQLPVDARQARMLLEASGRGVLHEVVVIVAGLSLIDPRERPPDHHQAADQAHSEFQVPGSDFLTLLKLWQWWHETRASRSRNQADKLARARFLNALRLNEWSQLVAQLRELTRAMGWTINAWSEPDERRAGEIHQSLLAGLLARIGQHDEDGEYRGARGYRFRIFPGSVLAKARPGWVMAAELVETTRPYARTVAAIRPEWLERLGRHLTRSSAFDPHWDRRSGRVMGFQRVSLFGLILVEKRRIHFGPVDPSQAREIFIRHALVRGEMNHRASFLYRNEQLRRELAIAEHKRRTRDLLADEDRLVAFFAEQLPGELCTTKAFARWYEALEPEARNGLLYDRATVLRPDAITPGEEYPDRLAVDDQALRLVYRFEPGHPGDGVTVICPLHLLNRLQPERLEWLVPGLIQDKVRALIASLPKSKRRFFVPQAEYARAAVEAMRFADGSLHSRLAGELSRISGLQITPDDFQTERLDQHLCCNVRVTGEDGQTLTESRELGALQRDLGERARRQFMARQSQAWKRDGLTGFEDLQLPEHIRTRTGHSAWPALVDQGKAAGLRLFDDEDEARGEHHAGVHRLVLIALADKLKYIARNHRLSSSAAIAWTRIGDIDQLQRGLVERVVYDRIGDAWSVRGGAAFAALHQRLRGEIIERAQQAIGLLETIVLRLHEVRGHLAELGPAQPSAHADIDSQLSDLIYPDFVCEVHNERLADYPRYLEAIDQRLAALALDPGRDVRRQAEIDPWWQRYLDRIDQGKAYSIELDRYRWLVEEYRVQTFAQQLGTREKVSVKRLREAWRAVGD